MQFLMENISIISTIVVFLILAGIVALIIRSMIKDKKAGKSVICGGNCSGCPGSCACHTAEKKR